MAFSAPIAAEVTATTLEKFNQPKDTKEILKHCLRKPLLRLLLQDSEEFGAAGPASGTTSPPNFREPVQGQLMRDQPSFYVGWSADDVLQFNTSDGAVQTQFPIRNMHAGWTISHDELAQQGVVVTNNKAGPPTKDEQVNIVRALELKKADYQESIMYARNNTLWADGTQDPKAIAGIKSIITDDPTAGTVGAVARANAWWRHVADTGVGGAGPKLVYSKADQTMTERLNKVFNVILPLYGGFQKPRCVAGSDLIDMIIREMRAKGQVTVTGWEDEYTNLSVRGVRFNSMNIEFDPTLDLLGESKSIYAWDGKHMKLRPQSKLWGKVTNQNQPSNQFVMLISTTDRATLTCNQMDCLYKGVAS